MNEIEARGKIKYRIAMAMSLVGAGEDGKAYEDLEIAIQALKEIREYRELGTVEEFHKLKTLFGDENVEVSELTTQILKKYPKYKSIGTVEELQELKEKNVIPIATIEFSKENMQKIVDKKVAQIELDIQEIRNKAIDDFVCSAYRRLGASDKDLYCTNFIDEIAEQMKGDITYDRE